MNRLIENNFTQEHAVEILADLDSKISRAVTATNSRFSAVESDLFGVDVNKLSSYFDTRTRYLSEYTDEYISLKGKVPGLLSGSGEMEDEDTSQDETSVESIEINDGANTENN